ncbi:hypothetical protein PG985_001480 [Apiospora marii]|uniref:T6SS Phospholipase effector Tle1-like catalytic domain-containing protein n=1 Tax=Apiospora marii TaxID=335849 RepID=A0ABR1RI36_9PEZI
MERHLDEHNEGLKCLINDEEAMAYDRQNFNAGHFMTRVGEECEKKRIFICCDGTGNNASGTVDPLTNVAKLARAVDRTGNDSYNIPSPIAVERHRGDAREEKRFGSVRQIVYYSSGVGTRSALITDSLYASAFGKGLSGNLLDAYCFLCNNYNASSVLDEIILAGFSRGAFTVRCLARFVNDVGLLRRSGLAFLQTVYKLWRDNAGYSPPRWLAPSKWPKEYKKYFETLIALTKVSAMWGDPLSFVGNNVPNNVENAFQAVSLHEKRKMFRPMLWEREGNQETNANIKQCIFAGCHSDIGGGNTDPALSSASFFWMMGQIQECGCEAAFNHDTTTLLFAIPFQVKRKWWGWKRPPVGLRLQSFAEGRVNESRRGWYAAVYWLSLGLWDGRRDSLWEEYLEEGGTRTTLSEMGGADGGRKRQPIGLTVHVTVRLLYEHRYRKPAVAKGDRRLRCGLFTKYRPEEQRPALGTWRWVKRGTNPNIFLKEDKMGEHERFLSHSLLEQAKRIHCMSPTEDWKPKQDLIDTDNECNWTTVNEESKWDPITKDCTYEQTFISLLEETLEAHTGEGGNPDRGKHNGNQLSGAIQFSNPEGEKATQKKKND